MKVYEGRIDGFDGIYLDDSWRGLIRFGWMRSAWEHGEIDITWWCRGCLSKVTEVRPACIGAKDWAKRFMKRLESTGQYGSTKTTGDSARRRRNA